jgi:hypothetical protein
MSPFYVKRLIKALKYEDPDEAILGAGIGSICVATHSMINEVRPADATKANIEHAIDWWYRISAAQKIKPLVIFGSCSHAFPGAAEAEERVKSFLCGVEEIPFVCVGKITNSVNEMEKWRDKAIIADSIPSGVLIVTSEMHSGAEYDLSKVVLPKAKVFVTCTSHEYEVQPDHPTDDQASWPRWLSCSIQRRIAFRTLLLAPRRIQPRMLAFLRKQEHKQGRIKSPV